MFGHIAPLSRKFDAHNNSYGNPPAWREAQISKGCSWKPRFLTGLRPILDRSDGITREITEVLTPTAEIAIRRGDGYRSHPSQLSDDICDLIMARPSSIDECQ